jgi:6-phospho-beta-glucosidase
MHNVMTAHAQISNFIHETSDAKIGGMLAYSEVYPASCRPKDVECARQWDEFINFSLLDCFAGQGYSPAMLKLVKTKHIDMKMLPEELKDIADLKNDFLSFSYYASTTVDSTNITEETVPNYFLIKGKKVNPYIDSTEWGWQIDPAGFRNVLNKMYQRYRIPVFPIENGIGVREKWDGKNIIEDDYRIKYHKEHIDAMLKAINKDGVEVLGYLGWGLIDILSSGGDMEKRYGLVYVNRGNRDLRDMKRVPKKSYFWFKKVIASGGNEM